MMEFRKVVVRLAGRLVVAAVAVGVGRHLIVTAEVGVAGLARLLSAMLCFVAAGMIFAPALIRLLAELTGDVCFSGGFGAPARPQYLIAADRRARGQYAEALAELDKIVTENPQEVRAYLEMLDIALAEMGDQQQARVIYRRGKKALAKAQDREALVFAYQKGCATLVGEAE